MTTQTDTIKAHLDGYFNGIKDDRTEQEKQATLGFWVATDSFLSGWGPGGRSLVACPVISGEDSDKVEAVFFSRPEFKRVRYCLKTYRPRLYPGDTLHIYDTTTSFRYH